MSTAAPDRRDLASAAGPPAELIFGDWYPALRAETLRVGKMTKALLLGVPLVLAAVSAVLLLAGVFLLSRLDQFAWPRFFVVFRWALLAYVISAGMIGFAFVRDHTRGAPLALVIVMLVIFALDVPVVIAFTVARYSSPPYASS